MDLQLGLRIPKLGHRKSGGPRKQRTLNLFLDSGGKNESWIFEVLMIGNSILPDNRGERDFLCYPLSHLGLYLKQIAFANASEKFLFPEDNLSFLFN